MNIAYIRVSTVDQNEERQINAMEKENIKKYFTMIGAINEFERAKYARTGSVKELRS